jgi:hypothetical protein
MLTLEQLLKSCFYVDSEGNQYFSIKILECDTTDEKAVGCGGNETLEQLFKGTFVINGCDQCSLQVSIDQESIDMICAECAQ